jgi:hypothetical protein
MDDLQHAVNQLVEKASRADEDPLITFDRVQALAYAARDGRPAPTVSRALPAGRRRPPRLTEPWFC